jgi:hypothetical protein
MEKIKKLLIGVCGVLLAASMSFGVVYWIAVILAKITGAYDYSDRITTEPMLFSLPLLIVAWAIVFGRFTITYKGKKLW